MGRNRGGKKKQKKDKSVFKIAGSSKVAKTKAATHKMKTNLKKVGGIHFFTFDTVHLTGNNTAYHADRRTHIRRRSLHMHARSHARTHTRTHTHTHVLRKKFKKKMLTNFDFVTTLSIKILYKLSPVYTEGILFAFQMNTLTKARTATVDAAFREVAQDVIMSSAPAPQTSAKCDETQVSVSPPGVVVIRTVILVRCYQVTHNSEIFFFFLVLFHFYVGSIVHESPSFSLVLRFLPWQSSLRQVVPDAIQPLPLRSSPTSLYWFRLLPSPSLFTHISKLPCTCHELFFKRSFQAPNQQRSLRPPADINAAADQFAQL